MENAVEMIEEERLKRFLNREVTVARAIGEAIALMVITASIVATCCCI